MGRAGPGPWVILALSLALTILATALVALSLHARDDARFVNAVQSARDRIETRLDVYVSLLRSTAALHAASGGALNRETFHRYVDELDFQQRYPGIQGIGYAARIRPSERAQLVESVHSEGVPDFAIWPDLGNDNTTTVVYLEPLDARNRAALGFDMFSEAVRREAMARAWRTGVVSMSGLVTLKQEIAGRKQAGFLLYVPVYRGGGTPASEAERLSRLDGFVYSPFRADDLFFGVFGGESKPRVSFRVYDGAAAPERLLHDSTLFRPEERSPQPSFRTTLPVEAGGRSWSIVFETTRAFEAHRLTQLVPSLAVSGLLISLVLFALARSQAVARTRAESSQRRGDFLLQLEDALRAVPSPEAIVTTSAGMLVAQLGVQHCAYGEVEDDGDHVRNVDQLAPGKTTALGRFRLSRFGAEAPLVLRDNRAFIVHDAEHDVRISAAARAHYRELGIAALVLVPLHRRGRFAAVMATYSAAPRAWSADDVELLSSVASRCWESIERARGENMLRESEARFRNMADQREQLLRKAEDAVRVRDDFLSIASHELKTPITALSLQSASLGRLAHKHEVIPAEKLDQKLEAMDRQMQRLNSLVEDLLNVSRIAAGRLQVQPEPVDLAALLREVLARSKPMLERAGCQLDLNLPPALEACLDPMRMQQIADNLLENARKYGAGKPVQVALELVDSQVQFVVRDHGIGIAPEDQSRIFERFERAVPSRHYGGLGLGLWITRQLVEAMGGSIRVESHLGRGATFTVQLPRSYQA